MNAILTAPPADFNGSDVRYLSRSLHALRAAVQVSDQAADRATDPRVRSLARLVSSGHRDAIRAMTAILRGGGRREAVRDAGWAADGEGTHGDGDAASLSELDGPDVDLRFIELLGAHSRASVVRSRRQMVEGHNPASRRLAEDTIRADGGGLAWWGWLT